MCHLEHDRRVPSIVTAEALISGLKLDAFEAEQSRAVALSGVGRTSTRAGMNLQGVDAT